MNRVIRLSAGTAAVAGLARARLDEVPTTAYVLAGDKCTASCGFCPQSRCAESRPGFLSRVSWPAFTVDQAVPALAQAAAAGRFRRVCVQLVQGGDGASACLELIRALRARVEVPVAVSAAPLSEDCVLAWLEAGADRVGLPLDAACERVYARVKQASWSRALAVVEAAAGRFPGQVSTHLIVGLGETEEEAVGFLGHMAGYGVTVGLFAFTPVRGTPLEDQSPPPVDVYRRVQVARFLLDRKVPGVKFAFLEGRLAGWGLSGSVLKQLLADGEAFRTTGCADCNRPYYNERPGGVVFNYPRPLRPVEIRACIRAALGQDAREGADICC
ncbi:MAG: radical SAM protein [Bacillota bacterium]